MKELLILGIGNILQNDDGIGVYAAKYLELNYTFSPKISIINGGVEGINLLSIFMEYKELLILDAIDIQDKAGSIYHLPAQELQEHKLNIATAHNIGVIECLNMLHLMDKEPPKTSILGIVPQRIAFEIGLSQTLSQTFSLYIQTLLSILKDHGIEVEKNAKICSLEEIISHSHVLSENR